MSFLSDYGASPPSQAAVRGYAPYPEVGRLGGLSPILVFGTSVSTKDQIIASNGTQPAGSFEAATATNLILRGYTSVVGFGNAIFNFSAGGNYNIDVRCTTELRNLAVSVFSGATINCGQTVAPSGAPQTRLTSVYNFGWQVAAGSTLNFTAFNNYTGLANFTCQSCWISDNSPANIQVNGCALTAQSVENILVALNNGSVASSMTGTLNLAGGTSSGASALTPAAAAARTSLIAKGYTVTLNP